VAELFALRPLGGFLPLRIGQVEAVEIPLGDVTSIAPFRGRAAEVSGALEAKLGIGLPAPGRYLQGGTARVVWTGLDQAFVIGAPVPDLPGAALTDQSDAWAAFALEGGTARDVLARLVPIDLREEAFAPGHAARTMFGHMACVLMRTDTGRYEIMVFRSMAGSAAHDLSRAMRMVAAREG
jgi:sarcosine oxidase subunit gamma